MAYEMMILLRSINSMGKYVFIIMPGMHDVFDDV